MSILLFKFANRVKLIKTNLGTILLRPSGVKLEDYDMKEEGDEHIHTIDGVHDGSSDNHKENYTLANYRTWPENDISNASTSRNLHNV